MSNAPFLRPGISLLYGFPSADYVLGGAAVPTAAACSDLCSASPCCAGYTWHSPAEGVQYGLHCYFVANPIDVWGTAHEP